jgi:hypothetical protein
MADAPDIPRLLETPPARRRSKPKATDFIIFAIILVVIIALVATIIGRLSLKHEVAAARPVADSVISRIAHNDPAGIRSLADKKFQSDHTVAELKPIITPLAQIYGKTPPTVDRQIVANTKRAQNVIFIYKYNRLKVPFYVRVTISQPHGSSAWKLVNFGGNTDETTVLSS